MQRLFYFFYQYRAFLFFVLLEVLSTWLIAKSNNYINAAFFNTSNYYVGSILQIRNSIQQYFGLTEVNEELAQENARLREELNQ